MIISENSLIGTIRGITYLMMVKFSKLLKIIVIGINRKKTYTHATHCYPNNFLRPCAAAQLRSAAEEKLPWQSWISKNTYTDPVTKQLYPKNDYNRDIFVTDPFENKFSPANSSFQSTQNSLRFLYSPLLISENLDKIFLSILKFIIWATLVLNEIKAVLIGIYEAMWFVFIKKKKKIKFNFDFLSKFLNIKTL